MRRHNNIARPATSRYTNVTKAPRRKGVRSLPDAWNDYNYWATYIEKKIRILETVFICRRVKPEECYPLPERVTRDRIRLLVLCAYVNVIIICHS